MSQDSDKSAAYMVMIAVGLFMLAVWWLSTTLGADFMTTLQAVAYSLPLLAFAGVAIWFFTPCIFASFSATSAAIWPVWWRVLDSIAAGGKNPDTAFFFSQPWWDTGWTKWGVESALIVLSIWLLIRSGRRY